MTKKKHPSKVDELKESLKKRKEIDEKKEAEGKKDSSEHYDKMLRAMAELDNFKKRSEREKLELVKYSNEKLITELLPVLDDLDRVLEHLPEGASQDLHDFVAGVQLVAKDFTGTLSKYGVQEIKTKGEKFNPEYHEAVAHVPSKDVKADHIIETHRKGYLLNDRVIRAAMVTVSRGKE